MSVQPVSSATGFNKPVSSATTSTSGLSAALEESTESAYLTRQEAVRGDQAAIRKLARQQQAQRLENPTPVKEAGKGDMVDHKA